MCTADYGGTSWERTCPKDVEFRTQRMKNTVNKSLTAHHFEYSQHSLKIETTEPVTNNKVNSIEKNAYYNNLEKPKRKTRINSRGGCTQVECDVALRTVTVD